MSDTVGIDAWFDDLPEKEGGYWVLDTDGGIQLGFVQLVDRVGWQLIDCWWGLLDFDTTRTMGFRFAPVPEPDPNQRVARPGAVGYHWRFDPLPEPSVRKLDSYAVYISKNRNGDLFVRYADWIEDEPVDAPHMTRGSYAPIPEPPTFCRVGRREFDARYLLQHGPKYACPRCQTQGVLTQDLVDQQHLGCPRCSHCWHTQRLDGNRLRFSHTSE